MIDCLGVLGAGHLAGFVCAGLRRSGWRGKLLIAEHRSAAQFAKTHDGETAPLSALPKADIVLLAVRPDQAETALAGADWSGSLILSAIAGRRIAELQAAAPGAVIIRAMPISSAALCTSPTPLHPNNAAAAALLAQVGSVIPIDEEDLFEAACANAAAYGWYLALIDQIEQANVKAGLSPQLARRMATETLKSAASVAAGHTGDLPQMISALATPGGITAHGLDMLNAAQALPPWAQAFSTVADRLRRR